jgi:hypothetical protein
MGVKFRSLRGRDILNSLDARKLVIIRRNNNKKQRKLTAFGMSNSDISLTTRLQNPLSL